MNNIESAKLKLIEVIEHHTREAARLTNILTQLQAFDEQRHLLPAEPVARTKTPAPAPEKRSRRKRPMATAKADDISSKIVKAVKAHGGNGGASRSHIVAYLDGCGYELGRSYSDVQLSSLIGKLLGSQITREGERAKTRYTLGD